MFFGLIRKPKWLPWPLICWDLFCLLGNCWTQFNETWQEARLRHFWLFLCIRWTDLNQLYRCFLPSFVFFQLIWRPRWLPWPLIGWYFFSTSLQPLNEWNLTGRKISTFWKQSKDVCPGLRLAETFVQLLLCNCWTEFQLNLTGGKSSTSSTKFVISRLIIMKARHIIQYRASASLWGVTKQTGTSNNFDKVWSGAPDGCVRKLFSLYSIHNMLVLRCTNVAFLFSGNCSTFATNLQLIFWRSVSFGICFSHSDNFFHEHLIVWNKLMWHKFAANLHFGMGR